MQGVLDDANVRRDNGTSVDEPSGEVLLAMIERGRQNKTGVTVSNPTSEELNALYEEADWRMWMAKDEDEVHWSSYNAAKRVRYNCWKLLQAMGEETKSSQETKLMNQQLKEIFS
jgi:hypothetical protein